MKVLIVEPYGQIPGHPSIYTKLLVEGMLVNIPKIDILSFSGFCEKWSETENIKHLQILKTDSVWSRLGYKIFGENIWHRYFATFFTSVRAINNSANYDTIHFIDSIWSILFFVWKIFGSPKNTILTLVGTQEVKLEDNWKRKLKSKLEFKTLKNWINRGLNFIIHSESVKNWVLENFTLNSKNRYCVIPWGIEMHDNLCSKKSARDFLKITNPQKNILLFFGLIDPRKNIEEFLEAIKELPRNFNVVIAGPSSPKGYEKVISDLVCNLKWGDFVEIRAEFIPTEYMMYYFRAADALILNYGNFPNSSGVLSHAIEYNLPVLASNFGQIGEFVTKFSLGLVFEPHNIKSIKKSVEEFLSVNEETIHQWKLNMRDFGKHYSWEAIGKRHLDFYLKIVST